jgi:hypothetical protein
MDCGHVDGFTAGPAGDLSRRTGSCLVACPGLRGRRLLALRGRSMLRVVLAGGVVAAVVTVLLAVA